MSTERWTAGDWSHPGQDRGTVYDENGLVVAIVMAQDEDDSDTHLIAAAPAMLDAAKALYARLERSHDMWAELRALKAAIDSAEGR